MVETAILGEDMDASIITGESELHKILETACGSRELMILVTPYLRFETHFLALDSSAIQARITISAEEAMYGLQSPDLHFRFPSNTRFLEGQTQLLGFGLLDGCRTFRFAIPKKLQDDEQRRAYRVERVGKALVTFSTPRFELKTGRLVDLSTTGTRLLSLQEPLTTLLRTGDLIAVSLTLAEGMHLNNSAIVRWIRGKTMGVEFLPTLDTEVLTPLSRWVFLRREEVKDRVGSFVVSPAPKGGETPGMVLISSSQEVEDNLLGLLAGLPPLKRVGASMQAIKEAVATGPTLVFFHVPDAGLDGRRRLKMLVEVLAGKVPFVLLGTQVENSVLFELGNEHKAAAVYDLGAKSGAFFLRLVQGILRRHRPTAEGP